MPGYMITSPTQVRRSSMWSVREWLHSQTSSCSPTYHNLNSVQSQKRSIPLLVVVPLLWITAAGVEPGRGP